MYVLWSTERKPTALLDYPDVLNGMFARLDAEAKQGNSLPVCHVVSAKLFGLFQYGFVCGGLKTNYVAFLNERFAAPFFIFV